MISKHSYLIPSQQNVKLIRYQFWCTRCAFPLSKSLQWYSGRKSWKSENHCKNCIWAEKNKYCAMKLIKTTQKWSSIPQIKNLHKSCQQYDFLLTCYNNPQNMVARISGQGCEIPTVVNDLGVRFLFFFSIAMWHFSIHFACNGLIIQIWNPFPIV
jgi:hypothetical protein